MVTAAVKVGLMSDRHDTVSVNKSAVQSQHLFPHNNLQVNVFYYMPLLVSFQVLAIQIANSMLRNTILVGSMHNTASFFFKEHATSL